MQIRKPIKLKNMKIELKNFRFYDKLTEETYCFTANLYVNGIKCGTAENRGYGGETDYCHEGTEKSKELLRQAEEYCVEKNLTNYIDELVEILVRKKEDEVNARKLNKAMQKAILIGDDKIYREIGFKMPLREMWEKHPAYFKQTIKEKLEIYKDKGYRLLNTNIPQQFLN